MAPPIESLPLAGGLAQLRAPEAGVGLEPPPGLALGGRAAEFAPLTGIDGQAYQLASFQGSRALVLAFLGDACPAVKACISELVDLQDRLADRGLRVLAINPNNQFLSPTDTPPEMERWAIEHRLNFPYVKDQGGLVARQFGARNTPHFLLLDSERRLVYRGRMFDSREPSRATTRDLEAVVRLLLDEAPVHPAENHPLGCSIVW